MIENKIGKDIFKRRLQSKIIFIVLFILLYTVFGFYSIIFKKNLNNLILF